MVKLDDFGRAATGGAVTAGRSRSAGAGFATIDGEEVHVGASRGTLYRDGHGRDAFVGEAVDVFCTGIGESRTAVVGIEAGATVGVADNAFGIAGELHREDIRRTTRGEFAHGHFAFVAAGADTALVAGRARLNEAAHLIRSADNKLVRVAAATFFGAVGDAVASINASRRASDEVAGRSLFGAVRGALDKTAHRVRGTNRKRVLVTGARLFGAVRDPHAGIGRTHRDFARFAGAARRSAVFGGLHEAAVHVGFAGHQGVAFAGRSCGLADAIRSDAAARIRRFAGVGAGVDFCVDSSVASAAIQVDVVVITASKRQRTKGREGRTDHRGA